MTQEDKELLLVDLCARLPYGVFINFEKTHNIFPLASIKMEEMFPLNDFQVLLNDEYPIQWCKPYLRPISSMTEKEEKELEKITSLFNFNRLENIIYVGNQDDGFCFLKEMEEIITFLNAHYFDYRGLIERGLALEALEGMYNLKD